MGVYYITVCNDSQHGSNVYDARLDSQNEITSCLMKMKKSVGTFHGGLLFKSKVISFI